MTRTTADVADIRRKAVILVRERQGDYPSVEDAITSIAGKLGVGPATLANWVAQADAGNGQGPAPGTEDVSAELA